MEDQHLKQFKCTDENKEKVLKFAECYFRTLRPEEKGSYPQFLSALNKEHPNLNLKSKVTFCNHFGGIEKWKRDSGLPFRSKPLTQEFKQSAEETFIEILSSLELARSQSIGFDDLFELADKRNQDLHLKDHNRKTLTKNFPLDKLKKAANERRSPEARERAPCAATAADDVGDKPAAGLDAGRTVPRTPASKPAHEGPNIAAQGSEPCEADAARGGASAERLQSPLPAMDTGDPFAFSGEYDYRRPIGGMRLDEDASVSLEEPPTHASVSDATADVEGRCDGADGDGSEGASKEAGAATRSSEGPAAVVGLPATARGEAATAASQDSVEAEGPGGNGSASVQLPLAPALNAPAPPASEPQAAQQRDSGDLTAFAPCIRCVGKTSDKGSQSIGLHLFPSMQFFKRSQPDDLINAAYTAGDDTPLEDAEAIVSKAVQNALRKHNSAMPPPPTGNTAIASR